MVHRHNGVRFGAIIATAALTFGSLVSFDVATAAPAAAVESSTPTMVDNPSNGVTADALDTAQINGIVWDQAIVGDIVYAGGQFTSARPAGVAAGGAGEVTRNNLMSYNIKTGVMSSWAPNVNGRIRVVTASPDGSRIYIGGSFTQVNGVTRNRIAAFNTADGSLVTSFAPVVNSDVFGITASNSTVYLGGWFTAVNSTARTRLAALNASNGALTAWAPTADYTVYALGLTAAQDRVVVAGSFSALNGVAATSIGSLSATDGTSYPFAANQVVHNYGDSAALMSMKVIDGKAYTSGFWYGGTGNFEGGLIVDPYDGTIINMANCLGDTYDVTPMNGLMYMVSHHHQCPATGGFPEQPSRVWQHTDAVTLDVTGTTPHDTYGYPDFYGNPSGSYVNWFPYMTPGSASGSAQAGWTIETGDGYLAIGGEFTQVNGKAQQGLVRFTTKANGAPAKMGGGGTNSSVTPVMRNVSATSTRVRFQSDFDRDGLRTMSYSVARRVLNTTAKTVVYTTSGPSTWWDRPYFQFVDTGLTTGTTYQYQVSVTDSDGNTRISNWANVTAGANVPDQSPYSTQVVADGASNYWRLDEASGSTASTDWVGFNDLNLSAGVGLGAAGAINGSSDTAATFSGTNTGVGISGASLPGPNTFSEELWFNTTSTSGGKLLGFGNAASGDSTSYDRHLYMSNDGHLTFGVYNNGTYTITSAKSYNDGTWHHVVASLSSAGMVLYVDGLKAGANGGTTVGQDYTGYWRVGGDNLGGWSNVGSSNYFNGTIDDVAIYPTALTRDQIRDHYTRSGRTVNLPAPPSDNYGKAVLNDDPTLYWRLGEASGTTADDTTGNGQTGTYYNSPGLGASSSVVSGNTAVSFDGNDDLVTSNQSFDNPQVFSEEAWFKTNSTSGGKIMGFGNAQSGNSSGYDRHIYMNGAGQLRFGAWTGQANIAASNTAYNDNQWHHVVATMGSDGMKLYVDGILVGTNSNTVAQAYAGYWRVGGDNTWEGANYFAGTVDEVAVYDHVLTTDEIRSHYRASDASHNVLPTGSIGGSCLASGECSSLTADVSDPDGTVTTFSWNFGDGSPTASGASVSHTYTTTGTYTITLTATDDQGGVSTFTKNVTVKALPPVPSDQYGSVVAADNPYLYWRLDEASGSVATDYSRYGNDGTYYGATTLGQSSTVAGSDTAVGLDSNGWVSSDNQFASPSTFTAEAWFNTTYAGGRIIGFSSAKDGTSGNYDRHVYLNGSGQLVFGVWAPGAQTITTSNSYNDGQWHQVVATMGSGGMKLYVDGGLVGTNGNTSIDPFNGYWKVGADNVWDGNDGNVHGRVDEAAVYDHVLSADDVLRHYRASTAFVNTAPTASFTVARSGLKVDFTGSGSDSDGTVQGYAWSFGDGNSSTDQSPSHTYASAGTYQVQLKVTDDLGASTTVEKSVTVRTAATPSDAYGTAVMNSDPLLYWRLADTSGTTALDQTGHSNDGTYYGSVGLGASSPVAYGNKAADFSAANNWVASNDSFDNPTVFSEEAWFKTTGNATGGKIIGFGAKQSEGSNHFDRHVYLDDSGHLVFGVYDGNANTITTSGTYNDDAWHYVVATFGPSGRVLYVDGVEQASAGATTPENYVGYWRVGQDNGWASNNDFTGVIDEVAVYGSVLSASDVAAHYAASTASNTAPTADFTSSCAGANCSFAATANDADGTVASYAWDFGDGSTGTGANPTHVYAGGTYTVVLTVTDNDGATTTVTHDVVVDTTNHAPTAVIGTPVVTDAHVAVDGSGSHDDEGAIASYAWTFGDGGTATGATAAHDYTTSGTYTIMLTVTDGDGVSASTTVDVTVTVPNKAPKAVIATPVTNDLTVSVDGSGSTDQDGTIASWSWNFGDGSDPVTGAMASHTYTAAGGYDVVLTVTDNQGATDTATVHVTVAAPNQAPSASFTSSIDGLKVSVDASASSDPDGTIASYAWDYGDGSTGTGKTDSHTYASSGTRTVTLTVTDNRGGTAVTTHSVTVTAPNQPPTASFTATPTELSVAVDASASSDSDGTITSYAWNFGETGSPSNTASGVTASHTYAAAGTYTVTLTVTDNSGASTQLTKSVTVSSTPAVTVLAKDGFSRTGTGTWGSAETGGAWTLTGPASFSTDGSAGKVSMTATGVTRTAWLNAVSARDVTFTGEFSLDKAPVGGTYYQQVFTRVVGTTTYYSLTARLEAAGTLRLILARMVSGTETQLKTLAISNFNYASGDKLKFRFDTYGAPATLEGKVWRASASEPASAQITATDGTAALQANGGIALRYYTGSGMTSLPLVVSTDNVLATVYSTTPVPNVKPTASFAASTSDLKVSVDASASSDSDGTIASYAWTYGDGGTGSGKTDSHTYTSAGTYTVTLTVTDDDGATDTTTKSVTVTAPPPNQAPTASFTASTSDLKVSVDASASADPDGTIASYAWDYGDSKSGTGKTASHTYDAAGTYTVKLTVTDDDGATDSTTKSVTVTAPVTTTFAKDAFSRTTASGWGTADKGGAWTVNSAANFSTDGSNGVAKVAAGSTRQATLNAVSAKDVSVVTDFTLDQAPAGGSYYHQVLARVVGSTTYYVLTARLETTGILRVYVSRMVSGTETVLKTTVVNGFNYTAGEKLKVRFDVSGDGTTTLAGTVWRASGTEPGSPTVTTTDTTAALQAAGAVSMKFYAGSTMTSVPLLVSVGDFEADAK